MLRITQNSSPAGAKSYYTTADYYTEGHEIDGVWRGKGAARLGLFGEVDKASWDALCDNQRPGTKERLTQRTKGERRVGYDFTFSVPKSVSLLYSLSNDERLLEAFRESVDETMEEIEAEMKTRVRKNGKDEDRVSGNMVWGQYIHTTSRPVDGIPDPGLHCHCFAFNSTWDKTEERWKAGQFADLKRDAPYFEAVFQSKLTHRLNNLGLGVERKKRGWDLAGVDQATISRFSRRTEEIEREAKRLGITNPDRKGKLGAKTREAKQNHLGYKQLQGLWRSWLTSQESTTFKDLQSRIGTEPLLLKPEAAREAVESAILHCFERKSVIPDRVLRAEALKRSLGKATRESVEDAYERQDLITADRKGQRIVTTRGVLAEERKMLAFAREGRGTQHQLATGKHRFKDEKLGTDQRKAVEHVLHSRDRVILIRGAAGTGKTSMMKEAVNAIEENGTNVFTFAPSADASRGTLRNKGFDNADTVSRLLIDEKLHEQIRGQVIWIDEAGLLGTVTTSRVFDLAQKLDARVVLSGDRKQHASVERGAALRLLEEEAGITPVEIKEIQRQRAFEYKQAIEHLSEGRIDEGFKALDKLEWIREVPLEELDQALAKEYADTLADGKEVLALCPTHFGGDRLTAAIRSELKQRDMLSLDEKRFKVLESIDMTEADRADAVNYLPGYIAEYHQNAKGHRKGERCTFGEQTIDFDQAARFQTFRSKDIGIAAGDVIRITKNGQTPDKKHKLFNGNQYKVRGFDDSGNLILENGWIVGKEFGHFTHGWVITSHASQGKSIDTVLVAQPADTFRAASDQQFYVSASRGEKRLAIFTDSKESLLEAVQRTDDRLTATEMIQGKSFDERRDVIRRQEMIASVYIPANSAKEREGKELAYER